MNKLNLFIAFLLMYLTVSGQEIKWQNTIGGTQNENFRSVYQTTDGGYICGGESRSDSTGDKTENCLGLDDYWIVKLDANGNIQWQNTIGGSAADNLYCVIQTSDGGFMCGGYSASPVSGDKTEAPVGGSDFWLVKLDNSGNIEWQNSIGGSGTEQLFGIIQTADGGYACGGWSNSNISGDKTENSMGLFDYWLVKLDSAGNIQWQNTIGGIATDLLFTLKQTSDGGFICGGTSESGISGDKTEPNIGSKDYWVVKVDASGNIQWQNTIGGTSEDQLKCIVQTADNGFICSGYSYSNISSDKSENNHGYVDIWVIKLDDNGNIQWENTIGGDQEDYSHGVIQTSDGGFVVSGYSESNITFDKTEISGNNQLDYWIIKLDALGNIIWQNTIGGSGSEYLYSSISETTDGGLIFGGGSNSGISKDKTEPLIGNYDWWIIKLTFKFNSIQGQTFVDLNNNNLFDTGDVPLENYKITELNSGRFGFSDNSGNYSLSVLDTGNFTVSPINGLQYFLQDPLTHQANFSALDQFDLQNDFAYEPVGTINDLAITISPVSRFRVGWHAYYSLDFKNVGTTSLPGTIIFYPDSQITYSSASVIPSIVTSDSVVWQTPLLNPFEEGNIRVHVQVDPSTQIGDLVNSCALMEPTVGDSTITNNHNCWEELVIAGFDPNDIVVNRNELLTTEFPNPPFLEYIIRFQNTGNDTAFNVKILNPIDTFNLQLSTLEFVSSSHPVEMNWIQWERNLEFRFDNIQLPDSNINEAMSHGYVRYRIKPQPALTAGDTILNKAYIYFDFNQPVATNNALTEIVLPTFLPEVKNDFDFSIHPNPAASEVSISFTLKEASEVEFQFYNAIGQLITTGSNHFTSGNNEIQLAISKFQEGVYYLKLSVDGNVAVKRVMKISKE